MVTTTTSPAAASRVPSYQGVEPLPVTKAPPWIQTSTGLRVSSIPGVHTFRLRQASDCSGRSAPNSCSRGDGFCAAIGPKLDASSGLVQGRASSGGRHRSSPTGGLA